MAAPSSVTNRNAIMNLASAHCLLRVLCVVCCACCVCACRLKLLVWILGGGVSPPSKPDAAGQGTAAIAAAAACAPVEKAPSYQQARTQQTMCGHPLAPSQILS